MKILTEGHRYELSNFEGNQYQVLQFIHKEPGKPPVEIGKEFVTVKDGTTNEEVLKVLIDRLKFLNQKLPSRETWLAITKCEEALMWLERRTHLRMERGVEGTPKP